MPPRNNPVPNAMRLFNCAICDKGYPRQLDYENHLRSYDHNHRQRLADMKKLTASNDAEGAKPKQGVELQRIEGTMGGKTGTGSRFTKIGAAGASGGLGKGFTKIGGGFKKVGTAVGKEPEKKEEKVEESVKVEVVPVVEAMQAPQPETKQDEDVIMGDEDEEEAVTWEEYDFTKPTGCDHANCAGCKTDGIWSGSWVAV
ncbi:hypothetical protein EKO04_004547 [Ascochyta lentis]|uniref:C2H2-type domain-containing protein n=1 Tax=Ascochyta lentis TaxID=205686 RepID=A0A8H7ME18_9PLEO|nr:hypothetical protein EKO04_004547 [Ascochyta lentis]